MLLYQKFWQENIMQVPARITPMGNWDMKLVRSCKIYSRREVVESCKFPLLISWKIYSWRKVVESCKFPVPIFCKIYSWRELAGSYKFPVLISCKIYSWRKLIRSCKLPILISCKIYLWRKLAKSWSTQRDSILQTYKIACTAYSYNIPCEINTPYLVKNISARY